MFDSRFECALCFAMLSVGCGGAYVPSQGTHFDPEPAAEINDDDVRKAFDARPQLGESVRIAYYTFDPEKAGEADALLAGLPGVTSVYRIPPLVVTGQRRFQQNDA